MRLIDIILRCCTLIMLCGVVVKNTAAQTGAQLYTQYCAACHGERGNGGVGVPLALESFQKTISDDYLFKTIRYGRPGRVMPAFKNLTVKQIQMLVKEVRGFSKAKAPVFSNLAVRADAVLGRLLFAKHCASCHGENGEGGKGTGVTFSRPRDLPIIAPALNNEGFLRSASDAMIRATLIHGRKGTPMMPAASLGLSPNDVDSIVAYIRSLQTNLQVKNKEKAEVQGKATPYIKFKSNYKLEETVENLKRAVVGANYRLIRVQYLNEGLVSDDKLNKKQVILYFCNFQQLNDALAIDPRIGLFLPCRFTIVEESNQVFVYAVNATRLSMLFNNNELDRACGAMAKNYKAIMEEANL